MPSTIRAHSTNRLTARLRRPAAAIALALIQTTTGWAADAPTPPEWALSADGSHIVQRSTRLAWPRCVEGQRWNGKDCSGEPLLLNHTEAQALARSRVKAEGVAWRLPHLKELQQLVRQIEHNTGGGNTWLPGSAQGWCWSGSPVIDIHEVNAYRYDNVMKGLNGQNVNQMKFLHGWVVNTGTGEARSDVLKRTPMQVRLVRPMD